jgi:hypothetical protein
LKVAKLVLDSLILGVLERRRFFTLAHERVLKHNAGLNQTVPKIFLVEFYTQPELKKGLESSETGRGEA